HHRVVDARVDEVLHRAAHLEPAGDTVRVTARIGHGHELDAGQRPEHARVVPAHHAQADEARLEVGHHAPAFATALTPATTFSRSSWLSAGWTGSDRTSAHAFAVSGRSSVRPNDGSSWFGIG